MLKGSIHPVVKDKRGNITQSANYRPVMQSSCLLKLIEMLLLDVIEEKICLHPRQLGFRKGIGTSDACFMLKETMYNYSANNSSPVAMFIDLSKAFDTVDHSILSEKLLSSGLPIDICLLLVRYLRNQRASVRWGSGGGEGRCRFVERGVRQGGILSPFLFKLYIDSVLRKITNMGIGCRLYDTRMNIVAYADDIVLVTDSVPDLHVLYLVLKEELESHGLQINVNKSKCLANKRANNIRRYCNGDKLILAGDNFEVVTQYKYLGHVLTSDLRDDDDIELNLRRIYATFNGMLRDFKHLGSNALTFLFNSYCKPEYEICLWNNSKTLRSKSFNTFKVAYSNAFRKMLNVPVYSSSHEAAAKCAELLLLRRIALNQARFMHMQTLAFTMCCYKT